MKERPILFSAPMIRAINAGRKTQTRRIVKWPKVRSIYDGKLSSADPENCRVIDGRPIYMCGPDATAFREVPCPYGQPGDRLCVRESIMLPPEITTKMLREGADTWPRCVYRADGVWYGHKPDLLSQPDQSDFEGEWKEFGWRCVTSIHMPRWACRTLLEVVSVRVERLQDISEADAIAESIERHPTNGYWIGGPHPTDGGSKYYADPRLAYRDLWNSINSNRPTLPHNQDSKRYTRVKKWLDTHPDTTSWDANPWVWVIEFRRLTA